MQVYVIKRKKNKISAVAFFFCWEIGNLSFYGSSKEPPLGCHEDTDVGQVNYQNPYHEN